MEPASSGCVCVFVAVRITIECTSVFLPPAVLPDGLVLGNARCLVWLSVLQRWWNNLISPTLRQWFHLDWCRWPYRAVLVVWHTRWWTGACRCYQCRNVLILEQVFRSRWGRIASVSSRTTPRRWFTAVRWWNVETYILGWLRSCPEC